VPVYTVLPDSVLKALEATPRVTDTRYFWSGDGKIESIVRSWQARLKKVFDLAKVYKAGGNAISHRFRDTFAVELLLAGVPIERVSILLGHQSVRVTEEHYNPWVSSRQEQLEADVASAWKKDPILSQKIIRTNSVHWRKDRSTEMKTNQKEWCPGWESNSHEEKSPEDFKSSASAIPPAGDWHYKSNQDEVVLATKHGVRQANTFRAPWIARSAARATGQSLRVGRNRWGAFNR
jgi:Phage integrase family